MPLVQAKCTNCGANLKVDNTKDAAICPYCNTAYIVEKAIASFAGNHYGTINASVVNIYGGTNSALPQNKVIDTIQVSDEVIQKVQIARQFENSMQSVGSYSSIYLKSDGSIGFMYHVPPDLDINIIKWKNLKKIIPMVVYGDHCVYIAIIGLTFDGQILVSDSSIKDMGLNTIKRWTNIKDIHIWQGSCWNYVAVTNMGTVLTYPQKPIASSLDNIERITEIGGRSLGQYALLTYSGEVRFIESEKNFILSATQEWRDIIELLDVSGELFGLTKNGTLLRATVDGTKEFSYKQIVTIKWGNIIFADGSLMPLDKGNEYTYNEFKNIYHSLGQGYVQTAGSEWFLHKDGRLDWIDEMKMHRIGGSITREVASNVISILKSSHNSFLGKLLLTDGYIVDFSQFGSAGEPWGKMFVGSPSDYGRRISNKVPDEHTKKVLKEMIENSLKGLEYRLNQCVGFRNRHERKEIQKEIDEKQMQIKMINEL